MKKIDLCNQIDVWSYWLGWDNFLFYLIYSFGFMILIERNRNINVQFRMDQKVYFGI